MARSSAVRKAGAGPRAASSAAVALALLFGLNLFNYIDRYILFGVQPLIQKEFAVNDAKFGALTLAFFLTYMVAAPATGWLGDWFPRKPLIVAGAMFWSVLTLLTALVHSYQALFLRHALVGIGEATFGVFAPVVLADFSANFCFVTSNSPCCAGSSALSRGHQNPPCRPAAPDTSRGLCPREARYRPHALPREHRR